MQDKPQQLEVRVTTKASSNRIVPEQREDGSAILRVYVTAVAENGKANREVIKLLATYLNVPKSALVLVSGTTSRHKRFIVQL